MTSLWISEPRMLTSDPVYGFLPLVLAGLTTAVILALQWFLGLISERVSSTTNPSQKEHLHEKPSSRLEA